MISIAEGRRAFRNDLAVSTWKPYWGHLGAILQVGELKMEILGRFVSTWNGLGSTMATESPKKTRIGPQEAARWTSWGGLKSRWSCLGKKRIGFRVGGGENL